MAGLRLCKHIMSRLAVTVLTALLLPACSAIKIAYNQGPDLAFWYLDAYVDFNDAQSLQVKAELNRLQTWHRQTQLPGYIDSLQKLQQQLPLDLSASQACGVYTDARQKLLAVTTEAQPAAAALASSLSIRQIASIERKFDKGNAEYREEFMEGPPKTRRERRYKKAVNRAEMLYGPLDERQLAVIEQGIAQSRFDAARSYSERVRRQQDALQTLRGLAAGGTGVASSAEKARTSMRLLLERSIESPDPAYRAYQETLIQDTCRGFAELHNSTSAVQRAKASKVLGAYKRDLTDLRAALLP